MWFWEDALQSFCNIQLDHNKTYRGQFLICYSRSIQQDLRFLEKLVLLLFLYRLKKNKKMRFFSGFHEATPLINFVYCFNFFEIIHQDDTLWILENRCNYFIPRQNCFCFLWRGDSAFFHSLDCCFDSGV